MTLLPVSFDPRDRRVLVTGGQGFIGQFVVDMLHAAGAHVVAPTRDTVDLRDAVGVLTCMEQAKPEAVVHLAGVVGGRAWLTAHGDSIESESDQMTDAVVSAAQRVGVERLLGVGSTAAYGPAAARPLQEGSLFNHACPEGIAGYARSKRRLGHALAEVKGVQCAYVLPCNVYGPGQRTDAQRANVVGALTRRFVEAAREGARCVECFGTNASREFLHVRDCAAGIIDALMRLDSPQPVNLGSGESTSIEEVTRDIARAAHYDGELAWLDTDAPIDELCSDATRARSVLAWRPEAAIADGLVETVRWYQDRTA